MTVSLTSSEGWPCEETKMRTVSPHTSYMTNSDCPCARSVSSSDLANAKGTVTSLFPIAELLFTQVRHLTSTQPPRDSGVGRGHQCFHLGPLEGGGTRAVRRGHRSITNRVDWTGRRASSTIHQEDYRDIHARLSQEQQSNTHPISPAGSDKQVRLPVNFRHGGQGHGKGQMETASGNGTGGTHVTVQSKGTLREMTESDRLTTNFGSFRFFILMDSES